MWCLLLRSLIRWPWRSACPSRSESRKSLRSTTCECTLMIVTSKMKRNVPQTAVSRISSPSPWLGQRIQSSLVDDQCVAARIAGVWSTLRTRTTASLCHWGTFWLARICKTSSKRPRRSITRHSVRSSCWRSRRIVPLVRVAGQLARLRIGSWADSRKEWRWTDTERILHIPK